MKNLVYLTLLFCIGICGCAGQGTARDTAKLLSEQLATYEAEVEKKIKAQQELYNAVQEANVEARKAFLEIPYIDDLKFRRSWIFADRLSRDPEKEVTASNIETFLYDTTREEFELYRQNLQRMHEAAALISKLENLKLQKAKIASVRKRLNELSKKPSAREQGELLFKLLEPSRDEIEKIIEKYRKKEEQEEKKDSKGTVSK